MTHPQPHRSEPDQGDSRARFLAAIPEFEGRTLKLSVVEEEIAWHFWQASEQRSAGAVGEPVADFYLVVGPVEDDRPGTSVEIGYATDLAEGGNGDSFAYDMCQSHINEAVRRCIDHDEPAPLWKVIPAYRAAPTASGDARDAAITYAIEAIETIVGQEPRMARFRLNSLVHVLEKLRAAIDAARGAA